MATAVFIVMAMSANVANAQNNQGLEKVYFLADTIASPKESRIVKLSKPYDIIYIVTFLCKCIPPYKDYVQFSYLNNKLARQTSTVKPAVKYLSWEELQNLFTKYGRGFDSHYELYITEVIKGGKYKTNKVMLELPKTVQ